VGSGQRGDKVRTYRYKDNIVIDHINNKKHRLSDIMSGDLTVFKEG
jgi:protein subunit release factor A